MSVVLVNAIALYLFGNLCNFVVIFSVTRLSGIVQFRFVNFASHFVCVQVFQIDFPIILYLYETK